MQNDFQELKELRCRNCNIKKVNPQVYNYLQHLGELDLGENQVSGENDDERIWYLHEHIISLIFECSKTCSLSLLTESINTILSLLLFNLLIFFVCHS